MRFGLSWLAAILLATATSVSSADPSGTPADAAGQLDLLRQYWRYHHTFGPPQYLSHDGKLVHTAWRAWALNTGPTGNRLATDRPAAGWEKAGFDDSVWCVQRTPLPFLVEVDKDGSGPYPIEIIRSTCARTRFSVANPAALRTLTFDVQYYGGLIVYVNGTEVARGNIPKDGVLAEAGYAEPYPKEAYVPTNDEQKNLGMAVHGSWWHPSFYWVPWYYPQPPEKQAVHKKWLEWLASIRRRKLSVNIDLKLLKPGLNVLAIENRCSPAVEFNVARGFTVNVFGPRMQHLGIHSIALSSQPAAAISIPGRPAGTQAWAEDIHRWLLDEDYLEPGVAEVRKLRLICGKGGAASGQAVIGTTRALSAPAATIGDLTGPGGAKISAGACRVRWSRTISLAQAKRENPGAFRTYGVNLFMFRYRLPDENVHMDFIPKETWAKSELRLFDQLSPTPPQTVAANTSQPIWVTVQTPANARPGLYQGELQVKAGGMDQVTFQVQLQVMDFRVPEPKAFRSYVGVDESPWALAKAANVKLWSEEHWRLIEQSIRSAGELGARVVGIPMIHDTELNNDNDVMIKLVRRADGGHSFDFSLADRYVDMWRKHCRPDSDVLVYVARESKMYVMSMGTLTEVKDGKESPFSPPKADTAEGLKFWAETARAVRDHFVAKGVKPENLHWAILYDNVGDAMVVSEELNKAAPGVGWARSSHEGRKSHGLDRTEGANVNVTWSAAVRHFHSSPFVLAKKKGGPHYAFDLSAGYEVKPAGGIDNPDRTLLLARTDSDVIALGVYSPLYQLRCEQEMAVTGNYRGVARISMDGWRRGNYFGPFTPYLLYPGGPGEMDGSAQFEALREGLQEVETRLAVESAKPSPAVKAILDRRTELAWILPPRTEGLRIGEYFAGWQQRSWDLYAAAAAAAGGQRPTDAEKKQFFGN